MMPAILAKSSVMVSNANEVNGFGAPSPTQFTVAPAVCRGIFTLNGT
jgi:hypothetical protein